jgi:acyl-CoA reductase-like NAD-dependent aldehyde dehydrogenase
MVTHTYAGSMRRGGIRAVLAAVPLLASCSVGGLDPASTQACDAMATWFAAGTPADQRAEVTARIADLLAESNGSPLADMLARFRDTREEDLDYAAVVEAGANFLRACGDHGWERTGG